MAGEQRTVEARALTGAHFRYFDFVMAAFVTILLLSNVLGAGGSATTTHAMNAMNKSAAKPAQMQRRARA